MYPKLSIELHTCIWSTPGGNDWKYSANTTFAALVSRKTQGQNVIVVSEVIPGPLPLSPWIKNVSLDIENNWRHWVMVRSSINCTNCGMSNAFGLVHVLFLSGLGMLKRFRVCFWDLVFFYRLTCPVIKFQFPCGHDRVNEPKCWFVTKHKQTPVDILWWLLQCYF